MALAIFGSMAIPSSFAATTTKCYTISSGNTNAYSDTALKKKVGTIYGSDELVVKNITGSYCKVTYPLDKGGTRTAYIPTNAILTTTSGKTKKSNSKITTYRRNSTKQTYGSIAAGDSVVILKAKGSFTQVRYPISGGYKFAFIKTSDVSKLGSSGNSKVSGGSHDIPDGWYMIISGNSDDRVLDINNWNNKNGGNLETYNKNNTTNQRFWLQYLKNGFYAIKVLHSGKYLHIADENDKTSNVHQWQDYNHNNAQWALKSAGNGYYYLQNRGNGSYLDNSGGSTSPGNNVISYPGNQSNAQKWKFVSTSDGYDEKRSLSDGWYEVRSANNNSYAWDINAGTNNGMDNGANLEIYQRHGGNNQKFYLKYLNNGYYAIKAGHSNKYLHKQNAGHTENALQWASYSTSAIQTQWAIASAGNGCFHVRAKAGNYVDNSGGTAKNGNNVCTYIWNGTNAQKWKFVSTSAPSSAPAPASYKTYYVTTQAGLILRKGPGTNYGAILTMPYASSIQVSSISNGWAKAKYNGYEGYCSSSYISTEKTKSITSFSQMDSRWRDVRYGYSDTNCKTPAYLGKGASGNVGSGCGVLALTNAVYHLNGKFIQPSEIAAYSLKYGYRINGVGTSHGLYKSFANNRGSNYGFAWVGQISDWNKLQSYLSSGKVVICCNSSHIMALGSYDKSSGRYLLLDSCPSKNRGTSGTGYVWATKSYLQNTVGIRAEFHILR
jgi:hypothetical protein